MKKVFILLVLCLYPSITLANFVRPVQTISDYDCSKEDFSDLSANCLHEIKHLSPSMYKSQSNNRYYTQTYSVLRGGKYTWGGGWDYLKGGHTGVDIITSKGTPLYSIYDGEVVLARASSIGYGNVVKIKHILSNGSVIYSIYAHMDKISVKTGDSVRAGQQIGTVGNTGYSSTPHLHFEINTTTKYGGPWYPYADCHNQSLTTQVNQGVCRDLLVKHSIDPLALLATNTIAKKTSGTSLPPKTIVTNEPAPVPGVTTLNTKKTHTSVQSTPTPTTTKKPLPPKKSRYREQAAKEQKAYQKAQKVANPSATYQSVVDVLEKQLPSFDSEKLSQEAQDFLERYELVIDGPEELIFEGSRDKISLRLSWVDRDTGSSFSGEPPFAMNLITLRDRVWVKESSSSDGSQLIFLTKRDDGINVVLWTIDSQIAYAKPLLSI